MGGLHVADYGNMRIYRRRASLNNTGRTNKGFKLTSNVE